MTELGGVSAMEVRIAGIKKHSAANGPGIRYVIFMQGCRHNCFNCHNPDTHDPDAGTLFDTDDIIGDMLSAKYIDGITLSGGDPFVQPEQTALIAEAAKRAGLDVWAYTGWTFEELVSGRAGFEGKKALEFVDVLVDGRYTDALRSSECLLRGSTNQRLIDVKRSLAEGAAQELKDE